MMQLAELFVEEFDLKLNQLRRYTKHGPSIGRYIEIIILNILKKYFPKSLSYSSGFVQGMNPLIKNNISSQVDIICYDQFNFPIVFDSTEIVVVPSKSVRGLIEIKSNLNSNSIPSSRIDIRKKSLTVVVIPVAITKSSGFSC